MQSKSFKLDFDIDKYKKYFPLITDEKNIINYNASSIDDCVWKPHRIPKDNFSDEGLPLNKKAIEYLSIEAHRLKHGATIRIKDELLWLPNNYYQYLNYGTVMGGNLPEFRLKDLKEYYFEWDANDDENCIGVFVMKGRQEGKTTRSMSNILTDCQDGFNFSGAFALQSMTRQSVKENCFTVLSTLYNNYPKYLKNLLYSDAKLNAESITFLREETKELKSRNLYVRVYSANEKSVDGNSSILRCVLDEFAKWKEAEPLLTFNTYKEFIKVGKRRNGWFDIFSSPDTIDSDSNSDAYYIWQNSDQNNKNENGTTNTGLYRYRISPLDGISGMFDKFGDADPNEVYDEIMLKRKNAKDKADLLSKIRGQPLSDEEMFETFDTESCWENHKGISERKIYVVNTPYKNAVTKEPKYVWGNLIWKENYLDTEPLFVPNQSNEFDIIKGRFRFSELPKFDVPLKNIFAPPSICDSCLGIDPFKDRDTKDEVRASNGAAIVYKDISFNDPNFTPRLTMDYACRPDRDTFFEDMLLACIYNRSLVQFENKDKEIIYHFESRGYIKWALPSIGIRDVNEALRKKRAFGDSPNGAGASSFMTRSIALINSVTTPSNFDWHKFILDNIWFEELLEDLLKFDKTNTKKFDRTMSLIQAVLGIHKMREKKVRNTGNIMDKKIIDSLYYF